MELTEKNGQASMEEILASIRKIIAEDPTGPSPIIDLDAPQRQQRGDGLLDDPSDFDLPSIFRSPAAAPTERATPLFGRLSEAIRNASANGHGSEGARAEPALSSLRLHRADATSAGAAAVDVVLNGNGHAASSFLLSTFHEATALRAEESAEPSMAQAPDSKEADEAADRLIQASPEVPRQMAAFKDTRFRGMGSAPQPVDPLPVWGAPVEPATDFAVAVENPQAQAGDVTAAHASAASIEPSPIEAAEPHGMNGHALTAAYPVVFESDAAMDAPQPAAVAQAQPVPPPPLPANPAAQSAAGSAAPIEDATADLLRPMLRQWLADNMPRMVEKALHIEVAEFGEDGQEIGHRHGIIDVDPVRRSGLER